VLADRTMQLQCIIQKGLIVMTGDAGMIEIELKILQGGASGKLLYAEQPAVLKKSEESQRYSPQHN
jgi:hypothetical protein